MSRRKSFSKEDLINSGLGKLFGVDKGKASCATHVNDRSYFTHL